MVARARKTNETYKQYRAALKDEAFAERAVARTPKVLHDAHPRGAANYGLAWKPDWRWVGKGVSFVRPRPREFRLRARENSTPSVEAL